MKNFLYMLHGKKPIKLLGPLMLISMGIGLCLLVFFKARSDFFEKVQEHFNHDAATYNQLLANRLDDLFVELDNLRSYFYASTSVTREEFNTFLAPVLHRRPDIYRFLWLPAIKESERPEFELQGKALFSSNFFIYEFDLNNRLIPRKRQKIYYPAWYETSAEKSSSIIGYDFSSDPRRTETIEKARDLGQIVVTPEVYGFRNGKLVKAFNVYAPVYQSSVSLATLEERRKYFRGTVVSAFELREVVDAVLARLPQLDLPIEIYDENYLIYDSLSAKAGARLNHIPIYLRIIYPNALENEYQHKWGMQQWIVHVKSGPQWISRHFSWSHWILLFGGLILVGLGVSFSTNLITQRQRAEALVQKRTAELKASEEKYRTIYESAQVGFFRTTMENGFLLDCNDRFAQIFGYPHRQAMLADNWIGHPHWAIPEDLNRFREAYDKPGVEGFESDWIIRDGSIRHFILAARFFPQQNYLDGNVMDITERRAAELELKKYREHLEEMVTKRTAALQNEIVTRQKIENELRTERAQLVSIFESINQAIYVADLDNYQILYANKKLTDLRGAKLVGQKCYQALHGLESPCPFCTNEQIKKLNYQPYQWEQCNPQLNRYYHVIDRVIRWSDGRDVRFELAIDITEQKKAEQKLSHLLEDLEQKNKAQESIIYVASHDLRAPLINISGFSQRMEKDCQNVERILQEETNDWPARLDLIKSYNMRQIEALRFIRTSEAKMATLFNGLILVSRTGRMPLKWQQINMKSLLSSVIDSLRFQIENIHGNVQLEAMETCWGDEAQINQVFTNLIDNAIKYRDPQRQLTIKLTGELRGEQIIYCLADNGLGIAPDHQTKIWELFHRLDPQSEIAGEGVGLTLVRIIVERHYGRVWLESQVGVGSRFYLSLPAAKPQELASLPS